MGVVTWKNIAPSNPAGILNAATEAAKAMGEGFAGIGTAAQDYSDKRSERETNDFITDLMTAGSQEERNTMIGEANDAWLNLEAVNATNYELGQPERDLEVAKAAEGRANETWEDQLKATQDAEALAYTKKLADDFAYSEKMEEEIYGPRAKKIADALKAKNDAIAAAKVLADNKDLYKNYGDDPTEFLKNKYGFFEGGIWSGLNPTGAAMGMDDLQDLDWWGGKFGSEYDRKAFNDFVVKGGIMFDDQLGGRDTFYFIDTSGNAVEMRRSYSKEKAQLLHDAILAYKGDTSADLAQQGGFFNVLNDAAKADYPDLYALIDNPDTDKNEFLDLFATLSDTQKSSTGLSEAFLKAYITGDTSDTTILDTEESTASKQTQNTAKGNILGMSVPNMELMLGDLLAIKNPSELDTETIRQLLLATEK